MPVARSSRYVTDPASAGAAGGIVLPFSVFDTTRIMAAVQAGLIDGLPPMDDPTDELLIATVVELGMPLWSADQMRYHPGLRLQYYLVWLDVREAAKGNAESQERIDACIASWAQMRKDELVSDQPNHTVGFWER